MVKDNSIYWIIGVLAVIIILTQPNILEKFSLFSISEITGSNIVPKNIAYVKDNVIYLNSNVLELELFDSSNPQCAGSKGGIIQQRIKLNDKGYRCENIPKQCHDGVEATFDCPLKECDFSIELPNELEPGIYNVSVDIGIGWSQSTFCVRNKFNSLSANFKIGITGTGYNLINNECILIEGIPEFNTLLECIENIVPEEPIIEGYIIEDNECILVTENIIYDNLEECQEDIIYESEEFCGDGICNGPESFEDCPEDCSKICPSVVGYKIENNECIFTTNGCEVNYGTLEECEDSLGIDFGTITVPIAKTSNLYLFFGIFIVLIIFLIYQGKTNGN